MSSQVTNDHDLVIWKRTFPQQQKKILKQVFNKTVLPLFQRRERRAPVLYTGEQELKDECIISLLSFQCS